MTTITKEQVHAVSDLKAGYTLGHADVAILNELARIALASLEAPAVMYASQETLDAAEQGEHLLRTLSKPSGDAVIPLYITPPAPVSVPDELLSELLAIAKKAADIADECAHAEFSDDSMEHSTAIADWERRASMQGKAEPVTTDYKLRDGVETLRNSGIAIDAGKIQAERNIGNSPVIPDGWVLVPMWLTAENGAKGALLGEFSETKFINCPECFGDDECETCDGSGRIETKVPVSWTNIKAIWAKGVEHFSAAPQQEVKGE